MKERHFVGTPHRQPSRFRADVASAEEAAEPAQFEPRKGRKKDIEAIHLGPLDVVPCTRCGLRGHVAGDPDRCYQRISLGLGGSQLRGQ
jgi:hypothetical protein